jgi:pimeloyl-ACP methyl ester carboxylesterase
MKKQLTLVLSFALPLAILPACGEGEPNNTGGHGGQTSSSSSSSSSTSSSSGGGTGGHGGMPVSACTQALQTKAAAHQSELASWSTDDVPAMAASAATAPYDDTGFAGHYRDDLTKHPGCKPRMATDPVYAGKDFLDSKNEATVAAGVPVQGADATKPGYVPGYPCAAKEYTGGTVDTSKPIVILVHGNSSSPVSWEEYKNSNLVDQDPNTPGIQLNTLTKFAFTADDPSKPPRAMLASKLVSAGYRVIAVDFRTDLVLTLKNANLAAKPTDPGYGDAAGNIDHGWASPILESLVESVIKANPNQKISLVGHSLGTTVIMDALRRTYKRFKAGTFSDNPYAHIHSVVLASGAVHGVAGGDANCALYTTMRGAVNCEMGDRANYKPTAFDKVNEGPEDLFAVPCADGSYAFGEKDACGGNTIQWFTTTIQDPPSGPLMDEFVSESAARVNMDKYDATTKKVLDPQCVDNHVNALTAFDTSGFFMDVAGLNGFLATHFGTIRSDEGMTYIVNALAK